MIRQIAITGILVLSSALHIVGQEILIPSEINHAKWGSEGTPNLKSAPVLPLHLPIVEDFSYPGPYPDSRIWDDKNVFINSTFAINPLTVGVATFDALDHSGKIYEEASQNPFQFRADVLTTLPIRLDSVFAPAPIRLSPADSIMLSFYFQPQGRGSAPRTRDSLALEFLRTPGYFAHDPENPGQQIWIEDQWANVWSTSGASLKDFMVKNNGKYFQRVKIKIEDTIYLRNDFKFRFRNYGSFPLTKSPDNFAGNTGIWNIDYITLDYGRTTADTFYYDIAFVEPAHSILRRYHSMPWAQYLINPQSHLKSNLNLTITNLDNRTYNYSYAYQIRNEQGALIRNYSGGTWNIAPFYIAGFQNYAPHTNPILIPNPLPATAGDFRWFRIYHIIRAGARGDDLSRNDTIVFNQIFDNYFSYDDGIPEAGYGLIGFNPRGALRYVLSTPDTLTEVKFFFNPTLHEQNKEPFYLKVWKSLHTEQIIYQSEVLTTDFNPGINEFVSYELSTPLIVSDTIYVGWQQITNDVLNIGFDMNNNARENLFFNTHGQWMRSIIDGALMVRPVFGEPKFENIPRNAPVVSPKVFPNPASGQRVTIDLGAIHDTRFTVKVLDIAGREIFRVNDQNEIDISNLKNGMYILEITNHSNNTITGSKLFIAR